MRFKFNIEDTVFTVCVIAMVLFVGAHIAGIRNSQFGFLHELLDLFGNVSKNIVTGENEFDWGEWTPVDGEATEPTELTPEQIQQYVGQQLDQ
jgi:hypothetical protein